MTFVHPQILFLLVLMLPVIAWYIIEMHKSDASVQISDTRVLAAQKNPGVSGCCMYRLCCA